VATGHFIFSYLSNGNRFLGAVSNPVHRFSSGLFRSPSESYGHTLAPSFPLNIMTGSDYGSFHFPILILWTQISGRPVNASAHIFVGIVSFASWELRAHFGTAISVKYYDREWLRVISFSQTNPMGNRFWASCGPQCIDFRRNCFVQLLRVTGTPWHRHFR